MRLADLNIGEIYFVDQQDAKWTVPGRVVATLARWRERSRQRAELARLDRLSRRDIGVTDADVWRETRKAPWQA